jgi:CubicO group peptidase (beta-lactamase class C family)
MILTMESVRTSVSDGTRNYPIEGTCDPRFLPVLDAFKKNFADGLETGVCVSVMHDEKPVVDLWGGFADRAATSWQRDAIVNMMSCSKGVTAMCVLLLADRGLIDINAPVAKYWPEFAAAGKDDLPIRYILDHRAELPFLTTRLPRGTAYDLHAMAAALAQQAPLSKPGEQAAYHVLAQGFLLGEIIYRVTGQTVGAFFHTEFAKPLGLDYWIGLPQSELPRCADFLMEPDNRLRHALAHPELPEGVFWAELDASEDFNSLKWRTSEIPSANGHGNARALSRLYACMANGGELNGTRIMSESAVRQMTTEQHNLKERFVGRNYHQALGVILNSPPVSWMGPNPKSFGHHGAGGATAFGDPDAKVGFSYAMNKFQSDPGGPRGKLIEATYACIK